LFHKIPLSQDLAEESVVKEVISRKIEQLNQSVVLKLFNCMFDHQKYEFVGFTFDKNDQVIKYQKFLNFKIKAKRSLEKKGKYKLLVFPQEGSNLKSMTTDHFQILENLLIEAMDWNIDPIYRHSFFQHCFSFSELVDFSKKTQINLLRIWGVVSESPLLDILSQGYFEGYEFLKNTLSDYKFSKILNMTDASNNERGLVHLVDRNEHFIDLLIGHIESKDSDGNTPLHLACTIIYDIVKVTRGKRDTIRLYLYSEDREFQSKIKKEGYKIADLTRFKLKKEFLHLGNYIRIIQPYGNCRIVELLISKNAKIESENKEKYTPLHIACKNRLLDVIDLLLSKNANIEAKKQGSINTIA
jgi:ribulose bisphosphate carboxylase small subunit